MVEPKWAQCNTVGEFYSTLALSSVHSLICNWQQEMHWALDSIVLRDLFLMVGAFVFQGYLENKAPDMEPGVYRIRKMTLMKYTETIT